MVDKPQKIEISICAGTGGVAAGSLKVFEAFEVLLLKHGILQKSSLRIHKVGCRGFCSGDVLVDVAIDEQVTTYQLITTDKVEKIVEEHIVGGRPVDKLRVKKDYFDFFEKQQKRVLKNCGIIDPESIDDYIASGGYGSARKALNMNPEKIISIIKESGLRGRGGGGFLTGLKWESCRRAPGDVKYVLCNADEGDPGAFNDRSLIEGDPHSIIEGMIIGSFAIGAGEGYVYIRTEYPLAVDRLRLAITQAREYNFLGEKIFKTDFNFDIDIVFGGGAFVGGESTALMASIENKPALPRPGYVHSTECGLWGNPTNLNNVETWANVPMIIKKGPKWFAGIGTEKSKGTKLFSLVGKINRPGIVEVPMGIPLRDIVFDIGGGIPRKKKFKAVKIGGPCGGWIPANHLDMPVDYEHIKKAGTTMCTGGMMIMDEDTCMLDMARYSLEFYQEEGCGQCTPCREGISQMVRLLTRITEGKGLLEDIDLLEELARMIKDASLCALGRTAPDPVLSTLKYFYDEFQAHIVEKHCPAGVCKALTTFFIDESKCTGCTLCARNCPVGAIYGEKKEPHFIDTDKCVRCRLCYEQCKFNAVQKG